MAKYYRQKDGEWFQALKRVHHLACCDCGLVHKITFRLVSNNLTPGTKIEFKAERDERATGQMRRWMKKDKA